MAHEDSLIDLRLPEPARLLCGEEHLHTQQDQDSISVSSVSDPDSIGSADPDLGRPKLSHTKREKGRNFKFEEQERPL